MSIPRRYRPLLASAAALLALYAAATLRYGDEGFFTVQVLVNLLRNNSVLGIVAVGMTFVILSGGIDLSVGAMMSLASVVIGVLIMECHWTPALAIPAALLLGTALGAGMGALIHFTGIQPFIVTLAGMFFARGLGFVIHLESVWIDDPRHDWLATRAISFGDPALPDTVILPLSAIVFLLVVLTGVYVASFSRFGRNTYALGGDEDAALLMGLPVGRTKIAIYGLSGLCSGLAGAVLTLELSSGSHIEGVGLELDAIAAVVVGGTLLSGGVGSVFGTFMGVLIIGIILNVMTYEEFSAGATKVAIGLLLLVFVLLQRLLARGATRPA